MRDLGDSELPLGLGAVRSCTLPLQDDLTVINCDQPEKQAVRVSHVVSAVQALAKVKMPPRDWTG